MQILGVNLVVLGIVGLLGQSAEGALGERVNSHEAVTAEVAARTRVIADRVDSTSNPGVRTHILKTQQGALCVDEDQATGIFVQVRSSGRHYLSVNSFLTRDLMSELKAAMKAREPSSVRHRHSGRIKTAHLLLQRSGPMGHALMSLSLATPPSGTRLPTATCGGDP